MPYSLNLDEESNLIDVAYECDTSYQDRLQVLGAIVDILKDHHPVNVLIDVRRAKHVLSEEQELDFGRQLAANAKYFRDTKTAIVSGNKNPHNLIQMEAFVDGFPRMVEFPNRSEAMLWLNDEIR